MPSRKIKLSGIMFAGLIIVISFVYAINVQPVVFGMTCSSTQAQITDQFETYKEFNDFYIKSLNRYSCHHGVSIVRSDNILSIEDEGKILPKISNFYGLINDNVRIFELNDFVNSVIY
jgi:hypothetical protein